MGLLHVDVVNIICCTHWLNVFKLRLLHVLVGQYDLPNLEQNEGRQLLLMLVDVATTLSPHRFGRRDRRR